MDFIQYSIDWCKGEIFEGKMLALSGILILIVSGFYLKFGSTPFAKAMFIPLLLVGVFNLLGGSSLVFSNNKRIVEYQNSYKQDPAQFVHSEKKRTDAFIKWYPTTMWSMALLIVIGLGLFLLLPTPYGRSSGLALMLLGFSVLFLDHFSEERAAGYSKKITQELVQISETQL